MVKRPKWPLSMADSALWNRLRAKVAHMHEKKICQPRLRCQKLGMEKEWRENGGRMEGE